MSEDSESLWGEYRVKLENARSEDRSRRCDAWLNLDSEICGVVIVQMTMRHMIIFESIGHPILSGGELSEDDAKTFLWVLSKGFELNDDKARAFRKKVVIDETFKEEIENYLNDIFKLSATGGGGDDDSEHYASAMFDLIGSEYGWSIDQMLNLPVAQMLQLVGSITKRFQMKSGQPVVKFNPELDALKAEYLQRVNGRKSYNN